MGGAKLTERSLLETLSWARLFDHMLDEHTARSFMTVSTAPDTLRQYVESSTHIVREGDYLRLANHTCSETAITIRKNRAKRHLDELKPVFATLSELPQIEGFAITGSVAAGVNDEGGDVDVIIITRPGWVWRVRALAIYLAHNHPNGHRLCPNMVMASDHLSIEKSLYGARELMMMKPIKDAGGIQAMHSANPWVEAMLPNATPRKTTPVSSPAQPKPWWWIICRMPIFGRMFERFESRRRMRELKRLSESDEAIYTKSICRGHENNHRKSIEQRLEEAMEALE